MLQENTDNLDALIREEKERVAFEFFQEAWNNALQEGIEPAIFAEMALNSTLTQLHSTDGEETVSEIIERLPTRLQSGQFDVNRVLQ